MMLDRLQSLARIFLPNKHLCPIAMSISDKPLTISRQSIARKLG